MSEQIQTIIAKISRYFQTNNIPFVIVGGVAVLFLGRTRATQDVDIIVDHTNLNRTHFIQFLKKEGFDANLSDLNA